MPDRDDRWWSDHFSQPRKATKDAPIDYLSKDGRYAVCVEQSLAGKRGLYAALMRLGVFLSTHPDAERGWLVLAEPRMSLPRVRDEWGRAKKAFARSVGSRLAAAVIEQGDIVWALPEDSLTQQVAAGVRSTLSGPKSEKRRTEDVRPRPGQKYYEIVKVLLVRWLEHAGPIGHHDLAGLAGCSYPTVKQALERKSLSGSIRTHTNRSVELDSFPRDAWSELMALSGEMRRSFHFRDRSGGRPDIEGLRKRLNKQQELPIALGGVLSARSWHRDFDLHGTPRLDLVYHAPKHQVDLSFVRKLDPALVIDDESMASPTLVVHALVRAEPLFKPNDRGLPWADPIETVLDLNEMALTSQANQLLDHLRPEARLG